MTHFVITSDEVKWQPYLFVEAIFMGFHICAGNGALEILGEHTDEDTEFLENILGRATDFPFNNYDHISKNLVTIIKKYDPDSKIIQANSFEYAPGVYPDNS
jgi:hypothetical protein